MAYANLFFVLFMFIFDDAYYSFMIRKQAAVAVHTVIALYPPLASYLPFFFAV